MFKLSFIRLKLNNQVKQNRSAFEENFKSSGQKHAKLFTPFQTNCQQIWFSFLLAFRNLTGIFLISCREARVKQVTQTNTGGIKIIKQDENMHKKKKRKIPPVFLKYSSNCHRDL